MAKDLLNIDNFNIVSSCLGGFAVIFCLVSFFLKDELYVSEPLPSTLFGLIFVEAHWARPESYGSINTISLEFTRLALGIQLLLAGVQLPAKYMKGSWQSIAMLLLPVMTSMWVISALIIYLVVPDISFLEGLIIGACVTPTDPILCTSIVKGRFAEKYVDERVRNLILAEAGANDGFGYPFLYLALCIYRFKGTEIAKEWIIYTVLYEILLGAAYGIVIGVLSMYLLRYAKRYEFIDHEAYLLFVFATGIFTMGTGGLLGIDDLLACFCAGNALNWDGEYYQETKEDGSQGVIDLILNIGIFVWIGASMPWPEYNDVMSVWHFVVIGICILLFRRVPAVILCYKLIPDIKTFSEASFVGFFGPIAVGALFYLEILHEELESDNAQDSWLYKVCGPVIYFIILSSIIVHGLSIGIIGTGLRIRDAYRSKKEISQVEVP